MEMIHTGKVKDINLHQVPAKNIARAGFNLGVGYAFIPFIKIKSLTKSKRRNKNGKNIAL